MHQPCLRKETKADRAPVVAVLDESLFTTPAARAEAAAAKEAAWWLKTITKEAH